MTTKAVGCAYRTGGYGARGEILGYDGIVLLRLGNYQLEDRLGSQGAVETYRARIAGGDATAARGFFAVKTLRAHRIRGDGYQSLAARFMAAGQRLQGVPRPGVARVVEVNQSSVGAYVVSDFVVGVDLAGLLKAAQAQNHDRRATLDPALVSVVGAKLARVLAGAHAGHEPLHHLGLCPGNVVVTLTGDVMVLDFGMFASVRGMVDHGMDKWSFVAPELLGANLDDGRQTDGAAADLFALGGLLFYLLSGKPPVEARSLAELYDRTWEPLPELPGIPDRLNAAIRALTAPDPKDRCKAAEQALAWLTGVGESAPPVVVESAHDDPARVNPRDGVTLSVPADLKTSRRLPTVVVSGGAVAALASSRNPRSGWRVALALFGAILVAASGLLAFRLARAFGAKRAAQGVAIAQRRSGEIPAVEPQLKMTSSRISADSWLPAVPTPLPDASTARAADAASLRVPDRDPDPLPVYPAGRFVVDDSNTPRPKIVPNHLFVDTQPHGAHVWIDGVWKGNTPLDLLVGAGDKRLVLVAAGHRIFRDTVDAADGAIIRLALDTIADPVRGDAFLKIACHTPGRYPIFIDEVETGLLCPASPVPVPAGTHHVGVFLPGQRKLAEVEITVAPGPKPVEVSFAQ